MVSSIQKGCFDAPSNGGKNRKWFGTERNISSSLIRFNNNGSRTKRVCSKVKTDLNRSESPRLFIRASIKATDIGALNELTIVGGQRSEYRLQSAGLGIPAQPTEVGTLNAGAR